MFGGGSAATNHDDIETLDKSILSTTTGDLAYSEKYNVRSAYMSISIHNKESVPIEVTAYYFVCKKSFSTAIVQAAGSNTVELFLNGTLADVSQNTKNGGADFTDATIGIEPFHSPKFCKFIKITKQTRFNIPELKAIRLSVSNTKAKQFTGKMYEHLVGVKGLTSGILFRVNGIFNGTTTPSANVAWHVAKTYRCTVLEDNAPSKQII